VVTTIVHNPTANDRVVYFGQIVNAFVDTTVEFPVSHRLTDGFRGSIAKSFSVAHPRSWIRLKPDDVNNGKGPRTLADPQGAGQKRNQLLRFVQNPFIVHLTIESRVSQLAPFLAIDVKWLKSRILHKLLK
jgi:hypothetical protein